MNQQPVFILSNPRSGSSLLRMLLNSHDNIVIPPECGFIQWLNQYYYDWKIDDLDFFIKDLKNTKKIEGWYLDYDDLKKFIENQHPQTYSELCYLIYLYYGQSKNKDVKIWGDKNNYYIHHLDIIDKLYPEAIYIHLIRNPFDVINSYIKINELPESLYKPKLPKNNFDIIDEWVENNNKIKNFITQKNKTLTVLYENFISESKIEIEKICSFLNVLPNKIIENFDTKKYFDEPEITMSWKTKLKSTIDKNNMNNFLSSENEFKELKIYIENKNIEFKYYEK